MTPCSCGRPVYSKGLCKSCYLRDYRLKNKDVLDKKREAYNEKNKGNEQKYSLSM